MGDIQTFSSFKNTLQPKQPSQDEDPESYPLFCHRRCCGQAPVRDDCSDCVNHCKTVKKIKYVEEYEDKCHNEHRQKCNYQTEYKEECADKKQQVCEKIHKNKPQQHECQVCGGVEKDYKRVAEQQYGGY